jgi:membrane-associated phospholipid phosphatase
VTPDPVYQPLLRRTLLALLICTVLVILCYYFVDPRVAFFVHDHNIPRYQVAVGSSRFSILKAMQYPPPVLEEWAPAVLVLLFIRRAWGPFSRWETTLFAVCVSLLLSAQFKETLKFVFGRYWPDTWTPWQHPSNPSLIRDGFAGYGFHPFHGGEAYGSFPSGHTCRTVAITAVVWVAYPRWRWSCVLATGAVVLGLIGMNYHFVGDIVAGGFVGGILGVYTAHLCGLAGPTDRKTRRQGDKEKEALGLFLLVSLSPCLLVGV